jgi:23S rRNA (adenine2503-C2)-methyltransferase
VSTPPEDCGPAGNLLDLPQPALEALIAELGFERYRAAQVFRWLHAKGVTSLDAMKNVPGPLREALASRMPLRGLELVEVRASGDGSAKYAFRTDDGLIIESVLMPEEDKVLARPAAATSHTSKKSSRCATISRSSTSVCLSTQAGCGLGCAFCATARLGLRRSLRAGEIVGQVHAVRRHLAEIGDARRISNLVYMGMGEPLVNLRGTLDSLAILLDPQGVDLSSRRITVSTAGVVPGIEKLGASGLGVNLAVSLNATTQAVREQLMPIARKYPLDRLLAALRAFPLQPRRRITFEYVLLAGINDTDADAKRLPQLIAGLPAKVNVIPWNGVEGCAYAPSDEARQERFAEIVRRAGYTVLTRRSRGTDIAAACGQLAGKLGG